MSDPLALSRDAMRAAPAVARRVEGAARDRLRRT